MARLVLVLSLGVISSGCFLAPEDDGLDDDGGMIADDDGGDDGGDDVPANAYCDPVADWDGAAAQIEERVLELVNDARANGGTCGSESFAPSGALQMNGALRCAARVHSLDMANRNFFDHTNPDGEDPFVRMERAGYSYTAAGENIAAGQATAEEVMAGWLQSPGHCANILGPDFVHLGVGYVSAPMAAFPHLWTQTFAAP